MDHIGSESFSFMPSADGNSGTIIAELPYERHELQNLVAQLRMTHFGGVQVPFRVISINLDTSTQIEEFIPGCVGCGSGGIG